MTQKRSDADRTSGGRSRAADDTKVMERPPMDAWSPANVLETPDDTGDYTHRWIAEFVNGESTSRNVQMALREGYERVRMSELPPDFLVDEDKGDGYARTGGLILMRLPKAFAKQRQEYYQKRSAQAALSADMLQGVAGNDAVSEDRGSRVLEGREAGAALATMSKT